MPPMAMVISADEIGADGIERKVDVGIGAVEGPGCRSSGKDGVLRIGQMPDRQHARRHARLQFLGLAGQGDEGAGRLVAGDLGRQLLRCCPAFRSDR